MKADEYDLRSVLAEHRQFFAPAYQRRYVWGPEQWQALWEQVLRQHNYLTASIGTEPTEPTHFLGSLVLAPRPYTGEKLPELYVIDGQQRLATVTMLLAALRDMHPDDSDEWKSVHERFLVNPHSATQRSKINLTTADADFFHACSLQRPNEPDGALGAAYTWFLSALEANPSLNLDLVETAIIRRLRVVGIYTDVTDNVHRIFHTLNSSGVRLGPLDLLRNHVFMLLPTRADAVFPATWQVMESLLSSRFSDFVHSDTVASRSASAPLVYSKDVYTVLARDLEPVEGDEAGVENWLKQLTARAPLFAQIAQPHGVAPTIDRQLRRLAEWDTAVISHLVYLILLRHQAKRLTPTDTVDSLSLIESYLVRRMVAGIPTNQLNRIFIEITPQVAASTFVVSGGGVR